MQDQPNDEGVFPDDDDEDSRLEKKRNIEKQVGFTRNWARTCSTEIRGQFALTQPFHSYGSGFNNSIQLFGAPGDFLEDYEQELARRVLIMRKLFLEEFQDQIHLYVKISDELAEGRDTEIPSDDANLDEIAAAGWTPKEWKMVMRRLTRILIVMGRSDNFAYAYMIRRPNFTFEELLKEDEYPDSDDDDFNDGERDREHIDLFRPFLESTPQTEKDVQEMESEHWSLKRQLLLAERASTKESDLAMIKSGSRVSHMIN